MSILGTRVVRREDPDLLRGLGTYVADLDDPLLDGAVALAFVRSCSAHAVIESVDVEEARDADGVVAVFTAADLDLVPAGPRMPWVPDSMSRPWLAEGRARFVGEPIAVIAAETVAQAQDAAELVIVLDDPLQAVVDPEAALAGDTLLFPEAGTNLACEFLARDDDDLFADCEVVVRGRAVNQRVAPCPLEGRATAAAWSGDELTMWTSTQAAHGVQGTVAGAFGLTKDDVRIIAPDVGGGFGAKIAPYPEDIVTAWVARRIGRPTRWIETRSESMLSLGHGRDHVHSFAIGGTRDGRLISYELDIVANCGAYPAMAAFLPTFTRQMAPGTYDFAHVRSNARVAVTNTMSIEAYRGAGRPEATATVERAVDMFAAEIGMDPVEVRRINLISSDKFPFSTTSGSLYDVGDYHGALDKALAAAGYDELRADQARRRAAGDPMLMGIGVSTYVEITAGGSPPGEFGRVTAEDDGTFTVVTGASPHGQGLHTALASLAAEELGVSPDRIKVIHGDTAVVPRGMGTMGSRSLQAGGSAVHNASIRLRERATELAAQMLEADPADIVLTDGEFHVAGTPSISHSWAALARAENGELSIDEDFMAEGPTYPFGAHIAVVDVDSETGKVELLRLVACDDAGVVVNPLLLDGQRHGGIAQGVAQALMEEFRYDEFGTPLTSNFADYSIISATELPSFELVGQETPTPFNPLGVKGIGESGTIGSTPALQSAVVDALAHLGVRHVDMPASPERVWQAIQTSGS